MSLLRSDLCDAPRTRDETGQPQTAAALHRRLARGACGVLALAALSCSFDSRPNKTSAHAPEQVRAPQPASAAPSRSPVDASVSMMDAATDAMPDAAISVDTALVDSGAPASRPTKRPNQPSDAGATMSTRPSMPAAGSGGRRAPAMRPADAADAARADASQPDGAQSGSTKADAQVPPMQLPDAAPASTDCKPGLYAGTFSGSIQLVGLSVSSVNGTVRAQLARTQDAPEERLELRDGRVMGVDQDGNILTVNLTGRVNCQTDQLEDGMLEEGNFHNVGSDSDTAFIGTAHATYAQDPHSLVGTFSVEAPDTLLIGGRGTWSLIRNQ